MNMRTIRPRRGYLRAFCVSTQNVRLSFAVNVRLETSARYSIKSARIDDILGVRRDVARCAVNVARSTYSSSGKAVLLLCSIPSFDVE